MSLMQDSTGRRNDFSEEFGVITVRENFTLLNTSMIYPLTESKG